MGHRHKRSIKRSQCQHNFRISLDSIRQIGIIQQSVSLSHYCIQSVRPFVVTVALLYNVTILICTVEQRWQCTEHIYCRSSHTDWKNLCDGDKNDKIVLDSVSLIWSHLNYHLSLIILHSPSITFFLYLLLISFTFSDLYSINFSLSLL